MSERRHLNSEWLSRIRSEHLRAAEGIFVRIERFLNYRGGRARFGDESIAQSDELQRLVGRPAINDKTTVGLNRGPGEPSNPVVVFMCWW